MTKQCTRLAYSKTRLKILHKMLIVSEIAHKVGKNLFPIRDHSESITGGTQMLPFIIGRAQLFQGESAQI